MTRFCCRSSVAHQTPTLALTISGICCSTWDLRSASAAATNIFTREDVAEILNLQPKGNKAKPYQVRQVRHVIIKYKLAGGTQ